MKKYKAKVTVEINVEAEDKQTAVQRAQMISSQLDRQIGRASVVSPPTKVVEVK